MLGHMSYRVAKIGEILYVMLKNVLESHSWQNPELCNIFAVTPNSFNSRIQQSE